MQSRSKWVARVAFATAFAMVAASMSTTLLATDRPSKSGPTPTLSIPTFSTADGRTEKASRWGGADIALGLLEKQSVEGVGSPFLPPGQGGVIPKRPSGRPVGGNPDPGTPPGQPDDRPPAHAQNDNEHRGGNHD